MRQIFIFISLAVIGAGIYMNFFYDVSDNQIAINFFVSGFLIIIGISSLLMNIFWSNTKK
jgi:hypothetical protein